MFLYCVLNEKVGILRQNLSFYHYARFVLSDIISKQQDTSPFGKDVVTFNVPPHLIDDLYKYGAVTMPQDMDLAPNQGVVLKSHSNSALGIASRDGKQIVSIDPDISYYGIRGRNKEQIILLNVLSNPDIRCVLVTGPAGVGKSLVVGAYALDQVTGKHKSYEKMILSKPLEIVTSTRYWGTVPGAEDEKFSPFLKSFQIMFEDLVSKKGKNYIQTMITNNIIDFMPLELARGTSLKEAICWYDEGQNLTYHEMETLGSRIDDQGMSKLIVTGDLNQRDRDIVKQRTGMWKLATSPYFINSPHTAHLHLTQIERGEIAELFFNVFDDERDD